MNNKSIRMQKNICGIIKDKIDSCFDVVKYRTLNNGVQIPIKFIFRREDIMHELEFKPQLSPVGLVFKVYYSPEHKFNIIDRDDTGNKDSYIINQYLNLSDIPNTLGTLTSYCKFINDGIRKGFNNE